GLDNLLARELSQSADQLQTWFAALQGEGDESVITAARDAIAALRLTPAGFSHLMEIRTTLANGESLGDTDAEVEAAWNSVFDILSRAHRHQQFPIWAEQENDDGIVFGPKLFWSSAEPLAINPWLASEGEQAAWLAALAHRSQPPLIDPDQIPQGWILTLRVAKDIQTSEEEQNDSNSFAYGFNLWAVETPLDAFTFWEQRRAFVDERISNLQNARQGAANPLDALGAMLTDSNTGLTLETLLELREQEAAGQDIVPRLAQFTLEPSAYRFLAEVHILAEADTSIPIHMWDSVKAILVQAEKQREFAEWRSQERNFRITLHPNQFQILSSPDQVADNVRSEWLYNPRLLNRWVATLEARKAQFEALETALANAVSTAEAQILPQLRNLLIFFDSDTPGDTLREKAEWTDKRLLMDMFMDGCHMTTRVSHAIETLQRLVRGVYTQEHIETLEELTLDAVEDYEAEWPVMGTYATWRAYMLAYLFPENLLHLTPHSRQSYGFKRFKNVLRGRPDTKQICKAVTDFSNYFRDVCTLDLQAACQVWARQDLGGECEHAESPMESILFIFGLAPSSNQVYTANLKNYASPVNPEKTLTSWEPIPEAYDVVEILGATPHQTHEQIRLILLFVKVKEASQNSLKFIPYDIDQHSWKKPVSLDLPPDGQVDFSAVVIQKFTPHISSSNPGQVPTIVGIRVLDGRIYNRSLNQEATNWVGEEWKPLFGRRLSAIYSGICAIVQRTLTEYMMILEQANGALSYRIFSEDPSGGRDDGSWRSIGSGRFSGAFKWPGVTPSTFVFYKSGNRTTYSAIQGASELRSEGLPIDTISTLSFWLAFISGVSLNDYQFQDFSTSFEFFGPGGGGFGESLGLSPTPPFTGTLVSLLNLPLENWDFEVPAESIGSTKESIFSRFKQRALDKFIDDLNFALDSENDIDNLLREWKIADDYSRKFTSNKKGITSVIQDVFDGNQITFLYRGSTDPITTISNLTLGPADISFAPVNSDESFGDSGYRSIVLTQPNGFFNNLQRSAGATFEALPSRKIVPTGSGPFDLSIVRDRQGLQVKRQEIETAYLNNQFYLVRSYLKEAYNLVPLLAGFELQRQGGFEEALLWFCQVYNYTEVT
ncbi:MAG: neuraminidase-like domain-containing protein, partial [Cyanobacteria bacterium P01_D01_bin.56]